MPVLKILIAAGLAMSLSCSAGGVSAPTCARYSQRCDGGQVQSCEPDESGALGWRVFLVCESSEVCITDAVLCGGVNLACCVPGGAR